MTLIAWLESLGNIGDALVAAAGTVIAAVFAAAVAVWTWTLTARRDAALAREEHHKEAERDRADRALALADSQRQKRERINDIVTALHAEILTGILLYEKQTNRDEVRNAITNLTPFATPDETDFIFDSVKSEISILPSEVIHAVVAYYRSAQQTNLIIRDFRDEAFKSQSPDDKRKFLRGYISLTVLLKRRGDRAVKALADHARVNGFSLDESQKQIEEDTRKAMASARALIEASAGERDATRRSNDRKDRARHD